MGTGFGGNPDDYYAKDANEIRVAGEYLFTGVPSRCQRHRRPRRRLARPGSPHPLLRPVLDATRCSTRAGEDETHFTVGGWHRFRLEGPVRRRVRPLETREDVRGFGGASASSRRFAARAIRSARGKPLEACGLLFAALDALLPAFQQLQDARRDEPLVGGRATSRPAWRARSALRASSTSAGRSLCGASSASAAWLLARNR